MDDNLGRRRRRTRAQVALALAYLGVGALAFLMRDDLYRFTRVQPELVSLFILSGIGLGAALLLMLYLRGDISIPPLDSVVLPNSQDALRPDRDVAHAAALVAMTQEVQTLRAQFEQLSRVQVTAASGDREALVDALRGQIAGALASELEQRFAKQATETVYIGKTRQVFSATSARLTQEIAALSRRGNLNLTIGVLTTAFAVGLLAYMVLTASSTFSDFPALLSHYVPRLTTVIFIEVFSFFFLKLYRGSLAEIKFYQNELTVLDSHQIALEASRASADGGSGRLVLEQIVRRNPNLMAEVAPGKELKLSDGAESGQLKGLVDILERVSKLVVENTKSKHG